MNLNPRWAEVAQTARTAALSLNDLTRATEEMAARINRVLDGVHRRANDHPHVARTMGHHMTQAGLSEVYHNPEGRDWYVQRIMRGTYPDVALMSPENRALVAVAAIRGWVTTHD